MAAPRCRPDWWCCRARRAAAIGSSLAATIVAAGQSAAADQRLGTVNGSQHALSLLLLIGALEVLLILAALRRTRMQQLD